MWQCQACTLENPDASSQCEACLSPQPGAWTCASCTFANVAGAESCSACDAPRRKAAGKKSKGGATWQSADHLLNLQPAPRAKASGSAPPRRCVPTARPLARGQFVQGTCRLILATENEGWPFVVRVDWQCTESPQCPVCLEIPQVPRVAECGHPLCLPCATRYLEGASQKCPVCGGLLRQEELRPVVWEIVTPPTIKQTWKFQLVRRAGSSIGHPSQKTTEFTQEGDPGWQFARRVLADFQAHRERLYDECRLLEKLGDEPGVRSALKLLQNQLEDSATAFVMPKEAAGKPKVISEDDKIIVFYQSSDGQLVFLEPSVTKRLLASYGCWADLPWELSLRIRHVRKETVSDDLRWRHRFLAHLPAGEILFADGDECLQAAQYEHEEEAEQGSVRGEMKRHGNGKDKGQRKGKNKGKGKGQDIGRSLRKGKEQNSSNEMKGPYSHRTSQSNSMHRQVIDGAQEQQNGVQGQKVEDEGNHSVQAQPESEGRNDAWSDDGD